MSPGYGELFEGWEVALTRKIVRAFKSKYRELERESPEDLLQECLVHWYFVRDRYDPARKASEKTYMSNVIRAKLSDVLREYRADKRKIIPLSESLGDTAGDEASPDPRQHLLRSELKIDLAKTLQKLNPIQRSICLLIMEEGMNPTDVARRLGIQRSTVYYELQIMRKIFMKAGLDEYLK